MPLPTPAAARPPPAPSPLGQAFLFARPRSQGASSRPSTASDAGCVAESADEASDEGARPARPVRRVVETAHFVLEELDSASESDSAAEVVRPDHYEDAASDSEAPAAIVDDFCKLHCEEHESDADLDGALVRRRNRLKRWSATGFKRSHSQSIESDSDCDDADQLDAHDIGVSARRLRRRVRGPGDKRSSLVFDDDVPPRLVELEEPDGGTCMLHALPFWLDGPMDWESP